MAVASVTVTVTGESPMVGQGLLVFGTLAISANPDTYATGGLVLDKTNFRGKLALSVEQAPKTLFAHGKAGYHYQHDRAAGKLMVRQSAAAANPEAEIPAAAVPAGVSGDVIDFIAIFDKFPAA